MPKVARVLWGAIALGVWLAGIPDAKAAVTCAADAERWAEAMADQLPQYANREFSRIRSTYHVTRVSQVEVDSLNERQTAQLGIDRSNDEIVRVLFSTIERRRFAWAGSTAATSALRRHYLGYVARSRQSPEAAWRSIELIAAQPSRNTALGVPPHSETAGILGRAIRAWERQGCPGISTQPS